MADCAQMLVPLILLLLGGHHLLLDPRLLIKLLLWIIPASFMQLVVLHHCSGLLLVLLWRRFSFILKPLLCSGVSLNHCCWACCCQLSSLYSLSFDVSLYGCYWVIIWNSMLIFYPLLVLLVWYKICSNKHCNSPVALAYHSNEGRAIALHVCSLQRTDEKSCWCKTFLIESSH